MGIEFILVKIALLVFLLVLSAFFSASETALFSLDSIQIRRLTSEGKDTSTIVKLLENPLRCLTTILAGNTLVNIAITSVITMLLIYAYGEKGVLISVVATTLVLLAFGEVTPKTIAIHNNERFAYWCAGPLYFFGLLVSPFIFLASRIVDGIMGFFKLSLKKEP